MGAQCATCISEYEKRNELNHDVYGSRSPCPTPQNHRFQQNNQSIDFEPTPISTPMNGEIEQGQNIQGAQRNDIAPVVKPQNATQETRKSGTDNILTLIRVQAMIKGFIQRRKFRI